VVLAFGHLEPPLRTALLHGAHIPDRGDKTATISTPTHRRPSRWLVRRQLSSLQPSQPQQRHRSHESYSDRESASHPSALFSARANVNAQDCGLAVWRCKKAAP
jgi:hypothetical protein